MKLFLWLYTIIQLTCYIEAAAVKEDGCFGTKTTMTCYSVPRSIPNTVQKIFLRDINIERETLKFDSYLWNNVSFLDIQSAYGTTFKEGDRPIFSALSNLKSLGIHCGRLNYLDEEIFLGLPKLEKLDLSYSRRLNLDDVKKVFILNSSLPNLKELILSFINSAPIRIDTVFANNLGRRPIRNLELQGLSFIQVDSAGLLHVCNSLVNLNLSNIIYHFSNSFADLSCPSLATVDISRTQTRLWAYSYLKPNIGQNEIKIKVDLKGFPSLTRIYADNLSFDIPSLKIIETNGYYKCSGCKNLENLKHLYLRRNRIKWFNATCDDCDKFKLKSIDLSGNGLEYINPGFFRTVTTIESIDLSDNKLYVMEHFTDFKSLFVTYNKLRVLKLSGNRLTYIPRNILDNNIDLENIDLSNNLFTSFDLALTHFNKLKNLDIRNNSINVLRQEDFVYFTTLLNATETEFTLYLSGNAFTCDCVSTQFIKWLYVYLLPRVPQNPPMRCVLDGEPVPIDNQALLASQHSCERTNIILVSIVLSLTLFGVIISLVVLLKRFLKRKLRQEKREEYIAAFANDRNVIKYVVFLVFCSKEVELIEKSVYPMLTECFEKLLGVEEKVICDGVNEYRLGLTIVSSTERCIRQSSIVVFVCSNASCECLRCRREINIACDKDKPIATIILDEVPDDLPTPLIEDLLKKSLKAYLVYEDNNYVLKPTAMKFCKNLLDLASQK